jgi:hypothetical protein
MWHDREGMRLKLKVTAIRHPCCKSPVLAHWHPILQIHKCKHHLVLFLKLTAFRSRYCFVFKQPMYYECPSLEYIASILVPIVCHRPLNWKQFIFLFMPVSHTIAKVSGTSAFLMLLHLVCSSDDHEHLLELFLT